MREDLEGSSCGLMEVLFAHLSLVGFEENNVYLSSQGSQFALLMYPT
jgi:hypothetical protein